MTITAGGGNTRTVIWFSCGAASAVAAKLVLAEQGHGNVEILYTDTGSEHSDNARFIRDAAAWFGQEVHTVKSHRYDDTWQVWEDTRYLVGPTGARCTGELKKKPRFTFQRPDDVQVFGFTADPREILRADRFREQNPEVDLRTPLIERGVTKADCLGVLDAVGIRLPAMYLLGYQNNNCFAAETEFITDLGIRRLGDAVGETVRVRGTGGKWTEATVRSFGEQPLLSMVVARGGYEREIFTTAGHRWLVKPTPHGKRVEKTTIQLKPGDRLASVFGQLGAHVRPSAFGIAQGIAYGDGTRGRTLNTAATLTLCGEKDAQLLKYFPLSPSAQVAAGIQVRDLPRHWKNAPRLDDECQSFLYGWLAGYFAADGCASADGSYVITSARRESIDVARDVAVRLGIGTHPIRSVLRTGFGDEPSRLYSLPLVAETLRQDFFLLDTHRERFVASTRRTPHPWFVRSVEQTDRVEEVLCAVVPDGQAFALEGNILTGNCIGCVKGGMGYWNKIRRDFPDVFARMAQLEQHIGATVLRKNGQRLPLVELDPHAGRYSDEPNIECSILCSAVADDLAVAA